MKKRLLVATPVKSAVSCNYFTGLIPLLREGLPDYEVDFHLDAGLSVDMARNRIAWRAMDGNYDELVQIDEDMLWAVRDLHRLLSFDVDVVAAAYCKHRTGSCSWNFLPLSRAEHREDGLLECSVAGTGMMRIQVGALRRIRSLFPDLLFAYKEPHEEKGRLMTQFFEIGLVGPGSAEGRLDAIKAILSEGPAEASFQRLKDAAFGQKQPSGLVGEDFRFCMRARQAGLRVYVDVPNGNPALGRVVEHVGPIGYPITPDKVGYRMDIPQAMPQPDLFLENFGNVPQEAAVA